MINENKKLSQAQPSKTDMKRTKNSQDHNV